MNLYCVGCRAKLARLMLYMQSSVPTFAGSLTYVSDRAEKYFSLTYVSEQRKIFFWHDFCKGAAQARKLYA